MKDVAVEIQSLQNGKEVSYLYTLGKMKVNKNKDRCVELYSDSDDGAFRDRFTITMTGDDRVILNSGRGKNSSRFVFEKEEKGFSCFGDPLRDGVTAVKTQCVDSEMDACGGKLDLRYTVEFSNMMAVVNELKINIRPQSPEENAFEHGAKGSRQ